MSPAINPIHDPGQLAQIACHWEATARKVGNVHRYRDFPDLHYTDFLLSAAAIGPALTPACQRPVGDTILAAIRATRQVVSTNTNLGIVLLLAPVASIPLIEPLESGLQRILNGLTVDDSRHVFEAIRLACPGGLGEVPQQDVQREPTLPLSDVMALAAERDLVARQYVNGFREVLHEGVPFLSEQLHRQESLEQAIIFTHLHFLTRHPDSLIARKWGLERSNEVTRRAGNVLAAADPERRPAMDQLDTWLRAERLNPGTSADLVTACLFVALREGIIKMPIDSW